MRTLRQCEKRLVTRNQLSAKGAFVGSIAALQVGRILTTASK